jgi:hypothetical protein
MEIKSLRIKSMSIPLSILLMVIPVSLSIESASAVTSPSISVLKTSSGKSAIQVNVGTQYAGKSVTVSRIVRVSSQTVTNVLSRVQVGTNGKAVARTSLNVKRGTVLNAVIDNVQIVKKTITSFRIVSKLPLSSPRMAATATAVSFNTLTANGTNGSVSTTVLNLGFSADVNGLTAADITVVGATRGVLTRVSAGSYALGISGITVANGANITVSVTKTGFTFTPAVRSVAANVATAAIIFNTLTANGTNGSVSTTTLTLGFNADITGLSVADITVTGATKGLLTRVGIGSYTLGISGITVANGSNITVALAKTGFTFTPASRTVVANVATTAINFNNLTANGTSGSVSTSMLVLDFSADIAGFAAADITVTGATKGVLTRVGPGLYTLGISGITVANGSNITVAILKSGFTFNPASRTVAVNLASTAITFSSLIANGTSNSVTTSVLGMTFSADITGFTVADITVTGATKGILTRVSTGFYTLDISGIAVANGSNITVTVAKSGFTFTPSASRTVAVYVSTTPISFNSLTANGTSNSVTTTDLTLTFSADITGLTAADITVTGADKGTITRVSTGVYTLSISGITVANSQNIAVAISKVGFAFTSPTRLVAVNVGPTFNSLTANGTSNSVTTTVLTLTFSADIADLSGTDITVTGATKGILTRVSTGVYTLGVSGINANGTNVTVAVAKTGFTIAPSIKSVSVNLAPTSVSFNTLTANGTSGSVTTTLVTLTFSEDINGLVASDITITGATNGGTLTKVAGTGVYTLSISGVIVANGANITVAVAKAGFAFTPSSSTVAVNVAT